MYGHHKYVEEWARAHRRAVWRRKLRRAVRWVVGFVICVALVVGAGHQWWGGEVMGKRKSATAHQVLPCSCGSDRVGSTSWAEGDGLIVGRVQCEDCGISGPRVAGGSDVECQREAVAAWNVERHAEIWRRRTA